jgi:hypothetical protein
MSRARGKLLSSSSRTTRAAALACAAALAACSNNSAPNITPYPIDMDMDGGVVAVHLQLDDEGATRPAIIDTLSPLTVVDGVAARGEPVGEPERRRHDLTIYDDSYAAGVPRARFGNINTFDLHPCADTSDDDGNPCRLGFDGAPQPFHAILGADLWSSYAVRFSFLKRELSLFPDISGDDRARALLCETVFPAPFYGGGTLLVSGADIKFIGYRTAMGACMLAENQPEPDAGPPLPECPPRGGSDAGSPPTLPRRHGGLNALFVLSTGLPITLVSESFHARYLARCAELGVACDTTLGAPEILHIASGPITVRRTTLTGLTLVSEFSNQRGPCEELYANAFMLRCGTLEEGEPCCGDDPDREPDCTDAMLPCPCDGRDADEVADEELFCKAGAAATLEHTFPAAVISDSHPMMQGLRDELRTELPELDGILAPSAVAPLEIDMDYPNNRVILRCAAPDGPCTILPAVINEGTRDIIRDYCRM